MMTSSRSEDVYYENCPVCHSLITKWRTKRSGTKLYNIDICKSCGFAFVNPRPSLEFLMEYYKFSGVDPGNGHGDNQVTLETVINSELNNPNSTIDARRIFKTVRPLLSNFDKNRLLDVGCGCGFFSKEAIRNGFEVSALELAENDRVITKQMTGINPIASSFEDFSSEPNSYSMILMSQILEHVLDINYWMEKTSSMLMNNGIFVIALPNFGSIFRRILQEKEIFITPPQHLNFFSKTSLSLLLNKHGFVVECVQYASRVSTRAIERRLPSLAKPGLPIIKNVVGNFFKLIDNLNGGMIINIYARKK